MVVYGFSFQWVSFEAKAGALVFSADLLLAVSGESDGGLNKDKYNSSYGCKRISRIVIIKSNNYA